MRKGVGMYTEFRCEDLLREAILENEGKDAIIR
jgi:hypothetical protein